MGNSQLASRMLTRFAAQIEENMSRLAEMADGGAAAADFVAIIHTLQGSAGAIGALRVQKSAQMVEQTLLRADLTTATRHMDVLRSELRHCRDHIPRAKERLATQQP
jgi:HPt (histidine-containing phosphotransfer) domain-containing protein